MYVLLFGIHPLRIYLFDDGLARFATNQYKSAKEGDITDLFQHLTNYAINKFS
jgi:tubulin polyglutamylase TTLL6/13